MIAKFHLVDLNSTVLDVSLKGMDYVMAIAGYVLSVLGLIAVFKRKKFIAFVWSFSCFLIMTLIFLCSLSNCHYLRLFFLPSVALVWLFVSAP